MEELVYNIDLMESVDEDRLLRYLPLYGKSVMYQKTGFILSLFKEQLGLGGEFFLTCEKKAGGGVRYLTDNGSQGHMFPGGNCMSRSISSL